MTGFASFDDFLALPRVQALDLSPDGSRLVATVAELDDKGAAFVPALWEIDPTGAAEARRLTRSAKGERGAVFDHRGELLFVSARDGDDEPAALWRLPAAGEAVKVAGRPGGVSAVQAAARADATVIVAPTLPGAADTDADRRNVRKELKVGAALYRSSPVRYWDHDLGQDEPRLFSVIGSDDEPIELTPAPGRALDESSFVLTPDGSTVITTWAVLEEPGLPRTQLVAIDVATGEQRVLADDPDTSFGEPAVSADGSLVICVKGRDGTYDEIPTVALWLVEIATGEGRELLTDPDIWPGSPTFSADGSAVYFLADHQQACPVFRLELATGEVSAISDGGHHTHLLVAPDGSALYALRDGIDHPPRPVRYDASAVEAAPVLLPCPGAIDALGAVEKVSATATDGTTIGGRLVLPAGASADSPAPFVLWIHGGPLGSWNGWSWRWNPWLLAGRGYAVLLPDPALSTGYGAHMVQRGWGQWGGAPFTDLMTITDAVLERQDLDATRTAAMGGSYGGYMANWVAGHTDRFRCIVTHASLWALDQFQGTTDLPGYWVKEWGLITSRPERFDAWSPHHFLDAIRTPMLVVHGDKDYRVPVGEALRLWTDLQRRGVESAYLYYPDEGHWILKPGNARVWYDTVWAWLDRHVLDKEWQQPELL